MIRSVILVILVSMLGGCAHHRADAKRQESSSAYQRLDRAADAVGQVLYPPLYLAAFPLWFLSPGK